MTDSPTLDERVEVMAMAMGALDERSGGPAWDGVGRSIQMAYRAQAKAALTALESAGYVVRRPVL